MGINFSKDELLGLSRKSAFKFSTLNVHLLNVADKQLGGKNGSITPVDFVAGPQAGEVWIVNFASFLMLDAGDLLVGNFGAIVGPLANGLQLLAEIDSVENEMINVEDNADLLLQMAGSQVGAGGNGNITSLFNSEDWISGKFLIQNMVLIGDNGDKIIARVRDDLSAMDNLQLSVQAQLLI